MVGISSVEMSLCSGSAKIETPLNSSIDIAARK